MGISSERAASGACGTHDSRSVLRRSHVVVEGPQEVNSRDAIREPYSTTMMQEAVMRFPVLVSRDEARSSHLGALQARAPSID
jgi:hypothetical protein